MIWYSYEVFDEFLWLGLGGVNFMLGFIYYVLDYLEFEYIFFFYFDGKWFVYEWMRDWIYVVYFDDNY